MAFLPKSDLLTCTRTNSMWEKEARLRLLAHTRLRLTARNIQHHQDIVAVRGNCPKQLDLIRFRNLSREAAFADLIAKTGHNISHVNVALPLPNPTSRQYLEHLANSFPMLTTLKLTLCPRKFAIYPYLTKSPSNLPNFAKLRKLVILSSSKRKGRAKVDFQFVQRIPDLVSLFPNLKSVSCFFGGQSIPETLVNSFFLKLMSLRIINIAIRTPNTPNVERLTRLEVGDYLRNRHLLSQVLNIVAKNLQYLKISEVNNSNVYPVTDIRFEKEIVLPVMPNLKVFEFLQNSAVRRKKWKSNVYTPHIGLKFVGSSDADNDPRIVYGEQFPVLRKIKISTRDPNEETHCYTASLTPRNVLREQEFFETSVSFLFNSFIHRSNSRCLTLKELDVAFPPEDHFSLLEMKKCKCGDQPHSCYSYEWRPASYFWEWVIAMFPNVERYAAMGDVGEEMVEDDDPWPV